MSQLNPTPIRYPGGTITEDNFDPHSKFFDALCEKDTATLTGLNGDEIATVKSTLFCASKHDLSVDFCRDARCSHTRSVTDSDVMFGT